MAKAELTVTINALDLGVHRVVRTIKAADALARAVRAYGMARLRSERLMRDGDPLPREWMAVVEAHDALVGEARDAFVGAIDGGVAQGIEQGTPKARDDGSSPSAAPAPNEPPLEWPRCAVCGKPENSGFADHPFARSASAEGGR